MGELGLNGSIREICGSLSVVELAHKLGLKACILPYNSALECLEYKKVKVYGIHSLSEVIELLTNTEDSSIHQELWINKDNLNIKVSTEDNIDYEDCPDFENIIGQFYAKRGLEIAAAGGHNVIMIGSPGSGKSSLAKAMRKILPPMSDSEAFVTSKIYAASNIARTNNGFIRQRPFRSPHHTASMAAIIGGGSGETIQAGEVSLAQNGILFLDEYCQAPKSILEALRAPLEDRKIVISRLRGKIEFPASFIFIAATNPCPCGYYGEKERCICSTSQRTNYLARLSGPIIDRIDVQLWVHSVDTKKLINSKKEECSKEIAKRVKKAREIQQKRFKNLSINTNSEIPQNMIEEFCPLSSSSLKLLEEVISKNNLSARAFFRIIKLARTIADLENCPNIEDKHLLEAVSYRFLDKQEVST